MITAFVLTALAGAATVLGGLLAVHRRVRSESGLAFALAFAAGAMLLVSIAEIVPKGVDSLSPALGWTGALAATAGLALAGAVVVGLVQRRLAPRCAEPGDVVRDRAGPVPAQPAGGVVVDPATRRRVLSSGMVAALAVGAHNLPEGLATFVAGVEDPRAGAAIALAIAIHNVPEGVAVAAPVFAATGRRRQALAWAGVSGLAEPLGAVLGLALLVAVLPDAALGLVFGLTAGVMLQVSATELLPCARRLAPRVTVVVAAVWGAAVMSGSLLLLRLA